ncbi:NAD(P)-dependent oxidoreductase [Segatella copri]|jgi:NDP-sugar dehydratase or epimerase|uniref:NAD-dependent epimerase/dehydratase family protein n=1 Tax=Segatella copri TaxID=165179 RepID=UPI001C44B304|nr:NAD(P)-dependent oxidoreductase [Segatella copri]MBW0032588.1 NAD(P)-dependent oxidoreductase [Segatella copri]
MVLIIGATGYVGRYLSIYLKEQGYDVLALGRSKKVQEFFKENGVPFQHFDLSDDESFNQLPTENIEAVIDLSACLAEHETPVEKFFEVNTIGVYKMLEFCRKNGIKKFLLSSSHKVYNDIDKKIISEEDGISFKGDHSPYIISKIAAENFVTYYHKDFGIEGIVLRFTGVHGYGEILGHLNTDGTYKKSTFEIFFERILRGEKIEVWGDQSIVRDHIYIKDVLTAIKAAIDAKGVSGIYNLATGVGHSQYEEAKALNEVFGNGKSVIELHPEKPGLTRGYVYDITKIKNELHWQPKYIDMVELYSDYKKEWESKKYHNYHFILPDQAPAIL